MTDEHRDETEATPRRGGCGLGRKARFGIVAGALLLVGIIAGGLVTMAYNASAHGWKRGWGHHHGAFSVEEVKDRAVHHMSWWLETVDVTPEQEREAAEIVQSLIDRVYPLAEQHRANRDSILAALAGEDVDRDALETARRAELELADTASAELVAALSDVAEILTLEQRARLAGRMHRFRH